MKFLGCAQQLMEDTRVGERHLQATPVTNKRTRTTVMTAQVDLGGLRAASKTRSTET